MQCGVAGKETSFSKHKPIFGLQSEFPVSIAKENPDRNPKTHVWCVWSIKDGNMPAEDLDNNQTWRSSTKKHWEQSCNDWVHSGPQRSSICTPQNQKRPQIFWQENSKRNPHLKQNMNKYEQMRQFLWGVSCVNIVVEPGGGVLGTFTNSFPESGSSFFLQHLYSASSSD